MSTLVTRIDAIAALLWSPFVAAVCVLIACAVVWVARYDRRNVFAVRPEVQAERKDLQERAWGEQS